MLNQALFLATLLLAGAILLCCYRLWRGPAPWDRILALDTLYITAIGLLVVQNLRHGTQWYFEVALLIAALGFFSTVVMAKYLMRAAVVEQPLAESPFSKPALIERNTNHVAGDD